MWTGTGLPRLIAGLALVLPGSMALPAGAAAITRVPIACDDLADLRAFGADDLEQVTNARTGDTMNYVVIGDGASGDLTVHGTSTTDAEVLVMFPGTSGILPDWPIQMITNSTYSPDITTTDGYDAAQDGNISLCHDYYLVLFDYPGVGDTSFSGTELTGDRIADDVDAILDAATDTFGIATGTVSVAGWSLGTLYALKFAWLSPAAGTGRTVDDLALIASKPGGNVDDVASGNQASCITTLFDTLVKTDLSAGFRYRVEKSLAKLTFPYEDQPPYSKADSDGCTASVDVDTKTVTVSVPYDCPSNSECRNGISLQSANRAASPWDQTKGVPYSLYVQQRDFVADWDFCHCRTAGSDYTSQDCSCSSSYTSPTAVANGGVCRTRSKKANRPRAHACAKLDLGGTMTVINGSEDLVIQWTYGREMVRAYNRRFGAGTARHVRYDGQGGAGHSVLVQHPKWTQRQLYNAISD